jgi:rhodanese-related sulfurtransferase
MKTINADQLRVIINSSKIQLIDIREDYEFEDHNIGGLNIPMENLFNSLDQIDTDKQVILCCKTGGRASAMAHTLKRKLKLTNIYTLEGGVFGYLGIQN